MARKYNNRYECRSESKSNAPAPQLARDDPPTFVACLIHSATIAAILSYLLGYWKFEDLMDVLMKSYELFKEMADSDAPFHERKIANVVTQQGNYPKMEIKARQTWASPSPASNTPSDPQGFSMVFLGYLWSIIYSSSLYVIKFGLSNLPKALILLSKAVIALGYLCSMIFKSSLYLIGMGLSGLSKTLMLMSNAFKAPANMEWFTPKGLLVGYFGLCLLRSCYVGLVWLWNFISEEKAGIEKKAGIENKAVTEKNAVTENTAVTETKAGTELQCASCQFVMHSYREHTITGSMSMLPAHN